MNILITGASGLVGTRLSAYLNGKGHSVFVLKRQREPGAGIWDFDTLPATDSIQGVIHLAGENIATGRWTPAKKDRIMASRVDGTTQLAEYCSRLDPRPEVFVSASAVGYYGDRGETVLDETSTNGSNFVARVCRAWEAATAPAAEAGIRVVNGRIGMVLSPSGGTLATMLPSFRMGIAGVVGSGNQYFSWVHIDDLAAMCEFLLETSELHGPVNLVAREPTTNREFTRTLGSLLKRPTVMKMPSFVARTVFGQMADELILASCRVVPNVLLDSGFRYRYESLRAALADCLGR